MGFVSSQGAWRDAWIKLAFHRAQETSCDRKNFYAVAPPPGLMRKGKAHG
jgi:hypothetical protein